MNKIYISGLLIANIIFSPIQCVNKNNTNVRIKKNQANNIEIKSENQFASTLKDYSAVIADFYSPTCGHCKKMDPIINEIASEDSDIVFVKVNTTTNPTLAKRHVVRSTPTFIFYKNGKQIKSIIGEMSKKELLQEIQKLK